MGLISNLLLAPLLGPFKGALWIAEEITRIADETHNSPAAIRAALVRLGDQVDRGEITEEAFEEAEAALIVRLRAAEAADRGE